jgi:DNA-binding beta-propeller fold protein YncE
VVWGGDSSLTLEPMGSYHTGIVGGAGTEIVSYHSATRRMFSVNAKDQTVDMISLDPPERPQLVGRVALASFGSTPTSVTSRDDLIATCVLGHTPKDKGQVVMFSPDGRVLAAVQVGWHPDMVCFTPDGHHLVVADEGEPSAEGQQDGEGSVSIIRVPAVNSDGLRGVEVRTADFHAWDTLPLPTGVRQVEPKKPASQDFEPEGIGISGDSRKAYVSLQENDAIAVVDIPTARVERLIGLGYKDHQLPGNELDSAGLGHANQIRCCPVLGMYQPDNVGWLQAGGQEYLVLANEGDARDNATIHEEILLSAAKLDPQKFPNAAQLQQPDQLGSLVVSSTGDTDGDGDLDQLFTFGGRSITIITTDGHCVYESGHLLDQLAAERIERQTASNPTHPPQYRTKKGPEPECLTVGRIGGQLYVFVGLERDNGIVTFDVTDPRSPKLVNYTNPSDYPGHLADLARDIGPEGLLFVDAQQSPTNVPLLLVANEVSGTITVYAVRTSQPPRSS